MPPKVKKAPKDASEALNGKGDKAAPPAPPVKAAPPAPPVKAEPAKPPAEAFQDDAEAKATVASGKPDQAAYHAEQDKIKAEIDALQVKQNVVKEKISLTSKNGPGNDRRTALRAELDTLRNQQSSSKGSRTKLFEQMKSIQDGIQKKIKDLNAARSKTPYKTVAEVDAQVKHLEKQVESGTLKLGDEKRALSEISSLRRSRRTVESFQADQEAIEADRARTEELRKQLDDPEAKAASERFDAIRAELDELKKDSDEAFAGRNKLFDERNALQAELDALYTRKRESAQRFREASDRYWQKVNEDRARRAEKLKAQRLAEEEEKRREVTERLLEEAKAPAFQAKIEDCQTLIDYFAAKVAGGSAPVPPPTTLSTSKPDVAGVPKLELRQVEQDVGKGLVARKKKGEEEEAYFVGGKGKGKKGGKAGNASNTPASTSSTALNIPFATLSALLELSIPPPASTSDLPRAIEDLKTKKAWFEANQDRVTAEHVAKAEAEVKRLTSKNKTEPVSLTVQPPNGAGENPPEPAPTPKDGQEPSTAVPSEVVDLKLEDIKESEAEETAKEEVEA